MTGTLVKSKRQITTPPGRTERKQDDHGRGSAPPPPKSGEVEASSLLHPPFPVNGQKGTGAIRAVTWRTDPPERGQCKEVLVGKEGQVPFLVHLTGRPEA